jgi:hemoglobin-like flavoprotein
MKWFLALATISLVAVYVNADTPAAHKVECGLLERVKVKRQWIEAYGESEHRLEFGLHLFNGLFKSHPEARAMFTKFRGDNVYSPEFQAHGQRILNAIGMLLTSGDDVEALKVLVAGVKTHLAERGIQKEFYPEFRDALLETLPEYLEIHLDWDAWHACVDKIIDALAA